MANLVLPKDVPVTSFIDGSFITACGSSKTFATVNPATEETLCILTEATQEDVEAAVEAAHASFYTPDRRKLWRDDRHKRASVLSKIADIIDRDAKRLAEIETLDNGKTLEDATADVEECASVFRLYSNLILNSSSSSNSSSSNSSSSNSSNSSSSSSYGYGFLGPHSTSIQVPDSSYETSVLSEPIGVVCLISPWNYSMLMPVWKVAPALAAGCSAVLKPSELAPVAALELARIAGEAGVPEGVLSVLVGRGNVGAMLAENGRVDKVSFTGSVETGKKVMHAAAERIATCTLELGGKSPAIVFGDVDLDAAVEWIMFGIFGNQGQVCSATSRVLVHESIYDTFIARLVECTREIVIGPGDAEGVKLGPLISKPQFDKVLAFITEAERDPRINVAIGGSGYGSSSIDQQQSSSSSNIPSRGYFVRPTILTDVPTDSRVWREEIFGPVLCVRRFSTESEAVSLSNDSVFGLAASVFSSSDSVCERVARELRAGTVWINCSQPAFSTAPWGGFKMSGIGRELGPWGLAAFSEVKQVTRVKDPKMKLGYYKIPARL